VAEKDGAGMSAADVLRMQQESARVSRGTTYYDVRERYDRDPFDRGFADASHD